MFSPFHVALATPPSDLVDLYDRLAPRYDRLHRRWLRHAGGDAQTALEATVRALAAPGARLLDAGCGTGAFARRLLKEAQPPMDLTLLDPSRIMLSHCADIPAERTVGRLEALPFPDSSFDIVTCAWALETVPDTSTALAELCRVLRPGGALCLAFCARKSNVAPGGRLMQLALTARGSGRFLSEDAVVDVIERQIGFTVRRLPCAGPATALVAFRHAEHR